MMEKRSKARAEDTIEMGVRARRQNYDDVINRLRGRARSTLDIPPEIVPEGMVYHWVISSVYKSGDVQVSDKLSRASEKGWDPVPRARHPELASFDPLNRDAFFQEFIYKDGLILCERPKFVDDVAKEREAREINQSMRYVHQYTDGLPMGMGLNVHQNTVTRGNHF